MKPFLRPTDRARLAPVGWRAEPAGQWGGKEVEIVYDPHQHQVLLLRNDPGGINRVALTERGYRRLATDGQQELWVRDPVAQIERRLDRLQHPSLHHRVIDQGISGP